MADSAPRKKSYLHHVTKPEQKKVALFSHLGDLEEEAPEDVHWSFKIAGLKMKQGKIFGGNSRCRAFLEAFKTFVEEYTLPETVAFSRDLESKLDEYTDYIRKCRPLCFGMETAVEFLKFKITQIPLNVDEKLIKEWLKKQISSFIRDKILTPVSLIAEKGSEIITNGDVILIYGRSTSVLETLLKAKKDGKQFRVVVADSRPFFEAREVLNTLSKAEIHCTYVLINSISYHMLGVTRVFIGASGLTSNGFLLNRAGTALVCCIAHAFKKPVLVCCETYKFSEKVQIDSICYNEVGDPNDLVNTQMFEGDTRLGTCLEDWKTRKNLLLLNLRYDLTPAEYIDMLITEVGCIPVTSVPVVIREFSTDTQSTDISQELANL